MSSKISGDSHRRAGSAETSVADGGLAHFITRQPLGKLVSNGDVAPALLRCIQQAHADAVVHRRDFARPQQLASTAQAHIGDRVMGA